MGRYSAGNFGSRIHELIEYEIEFGNVKCYNPREQCVIDGWRKWKEEKRGLNLELSEIAVFSDVYGYAGFDEFIM